MHPALRHRHALVRIKERGVPVTFREDDDTFDPSTDSVTDVSTASVVGHAIELDGDPASYREASLTESNPLTLLFIPDRLGDAPSLHSRVKWNGEVKTVKKRKLIAPQGVVVAAKVIVA